MLIWEYATTIDRNNDVVNLLGSQIGLTDNDIDMLFIKAMKDK